VSVKYLSKKFSIFIVKSNFYFRPFLDSDGLPFIGTRLQSGDPFYCYRNDAEGIFVVKKFEGKETCYVDNIKLCSNEFGNLPTYL